jgi:hypothetical protein
MASTNESSPFLVFDNNVSAGLALISSPGNYWASNLNANGQALFNNGLWLDLFATTKLSFNFNNNSNNNISKTYNNSSGSSFGINVGYAFLIANNYNLIPHIGLSYANQLLAVNQNSIQQFIIEDPSYNVAFGVKNEMILIPSVLKASIDLAFNIGDHSSVVPNSVDGSLGHYDYTLYTVKVIPSIQWNITERFAMIGYYQFNYNFSNSMSSPNVEYPDIGVSSNQFLMNNYVQNTLGINFAVLF